MAVKVLHVAVGSASWNGRRAVAASLRWDAGGESKTTVRCLEPEDAAPAGYRALTLGLLEARRAGARLVEIVIDDPAVRAQVEGIDDPPGAIGPYLQVRALLNAFRWVRTRSARSAHTMYASRAAATALRPGSRYADLPLWAAASRMEAA